MYEQPERERLAVAIHAANVLLLDDLHVNGGMCRICTATCSNHWRDMDDTKHAAHCLFHPMVRVVSHLIISEREKARAEAFAWVKRLITSGDGEGVIVAKIDAYNDTYTEGRDE